MEAKKDRMAYGIGEDCVPVADVGNFQDEPTSAKETYKKCESADELDASYLDLSDDGLNSDGKRWLENEVRCVR